MNNYEVVEEMTVDRGYCDAISQATEFTTKVTVPDITAPTVGVNSGITWTF